MAINNINEQHDVQDTNYPEIGLMYKMLQPTSGNSALVAGCRDGVLLTSMTEMGINTTAFVSSSKHQESIQQVTGNRVDFRAGSLEDIPFHDNYFNYVCLLNVIEFLEKPEKVLEETLRVAKDKVFIGMVNKYSLKGMESAIKRVFGEEASVPAKLLGIWELKQIIRNICTDFPVYWRTVSHFPAVTGQVGHKISCSGVVQKYPFGSFVGVLVIPIPRFRTTVLPLRCHGKAEGVAAGCLASESQ